MPQGPAAAAKETNLSTKPLKAFNWTKLPTAKVQSSIWSVINDKIIHDKLSGKKYQEFEDLFSVKEAVTKVSETKSNASLDTTRNFLFHR